MVCRIKNRHTFKSLPILNSAYFTECRFVIRHITQTDTETETEANFTHGNTMAVDGNNQNNDEVFSLMHKSTTKDVDSDVEEVQPVDIISSSEVQDSSRLCGYLNKYKVGARGLGRNFKKRWFVFVDSSCKLLYFRTPQDIVPLGEIDVSNASFNMEVSHESDIGSGRDHVFEIRWVDL